MPKFEDLSLEKLKHMGSELIGSITPSKSGREVLPEDVRSKMDQVVANLSDLLKVQDSLNQAIMALKENINALCETSVAMCALKQAQDVTVEITQPTEPVSGPTVPKIQEKTDVKEERSQA